MISNVLHGDTIKTIKKFSFGDIEGVLLEYGKSNVFVPDSLIDKVLEYRKDSTRFISQFTAERYLRDLEELDKGRVLKAKEKTFLAGSKNIIRSGDREFTETQKRSIEEIYEKYSDKIKESKQKKSSQGDCPF